MGKSFGEMMTGVPGAAWRLNLLLPEGEYRYLYALLTEHNPVSETGFNLTNKLTKIMGKKIDEKNKSN
jgi:hypothetical protein